MNIERNPSFPIISVSQSSSDWLHTWGFDPEKESQFLTKLSYKEKRTYLKRNLESYRNEVLMDEPVSLLYQYYLDDSGTVYTHENHKPEYALSRQMDPRERDGLYEEGINTAIRIACHSERSEESHQEYPIIENSNTKTFQHSIVALYSPPGPASFDHDPENPFSSITYTYGQLYLLRWNGSAIDALAVKLNGKGDEMMKNKISNIKDQISIENDYAPRLQPPVILADAFTLATRVRIQSKIQSEQYNNSTIKQWDNNSIKYSITTPFVIGSFDDLKEFFPPQTILYTKQDGTVKMTKEIVESLKDTFNQAGTTQIQLHEDEWFNENETDPNKSDDVFGTAEYVTRQYYAMMYEWARRQGKTTVTLSGSCGGTSVETETLEALLTSDELLPRVTISNSVTLSIFGSDYRTVTQSEPSYEFKPGKCRVCGKESDVGPCNICHRCEEKVKKEE